MVIDLTVCTALCRFAYFRRKRCVPTSVHESVRPCLLRTLGVGERILTIGWSNVALERSPSMRSDNKHSGHAYFVTCIVAADMAVTQNLHADFRLLKVTTNY